MSESPPSRRSTLLGSTQECRALESVQQMPQLILPYPELPVGHSCAVQLEDGRAALLVMLEAGPRAYLDRCPHRGSRLMAEADANHEQQDPYMDATGGLILCHRHQACFEPQHGVCVSGPCLGERLIALRVEIRQSDDRQLNQHWLVLWDGETGTEA
ncbi:MULTISPECIES: Rieske (2Fe-2S) protein [Cobetia]|uniref:Rieske (2Fe-2S) protein n=1 Tax=Cobetia TaxID=204286 RepID=UPI00146F9DEB|nr:MULTISPECIES: Rieske 2Fe-2S domain-containing protein [Cobetia]